MTESDLELSMEDLLETVQMNIHHRTRNPHGSDSGSRLRLRLRLRGGGGGGGGGGVQRRHKATGVS